MAATGRPVRQPTFRPSRTAASFCYLCEVDRINGRSTVLESNLLQKGYSGSIRLRKEELGEELGAGRVEEVAFFFGGEK